MMRTSAKIKAIDLFCGVGGLTRGLESVGIDVRLGVDIDPACRHPLETNNHARFLQADVGTISAIDLTKHFQSANTTDRTLLAGCAPCQPFSTYSRSAKRARSASAEGAREGDWKLVEVFGELVRDLQPDLVTMENVPPLQMQPVFSKFLSALDGYAVDAQIVDCSKIGLPQTRKRLVLIASKLGPIKLPTFALPEKTVQQTIGNLPPINAGGGDPNDRLHRASKLSELNSMRMRASKPGGTWRDWPRGLRSECHERQTGATYPSVYGRMRWDHPSPTITTQCFGYGNGRFGHPEQDRAISLREAAMLQGFPRSYSFLPDDERVSFATLGRLIGNAVPVTLGAAIGRTLVEHVAGLR